MFMTSRRLLALGLAVAAATAAPAAAAEVALLKSADVAAWRPTVDAFRKAASAHTIAEYDLRNDPAEGARVTASLKGRSVIVVALGQLAAQAAKDNLPDVPIVHAMVPDAVRLGLTTLPNVTGVSAIIPIKNQLAAFRMVNPRGVRLGVVYSEANVGPMVADALKAAPVVRMQVTGRPVASDREVPSTLRALLQEVDAIWVPPDPLLLGDEARRFVLSETLKAGKPVYGFSAALVQEGALVSNGPDLASTGEQLADLVNRIAGGEKAKIEMLVPRAELVINKKVADKLNIALPPDALKAAARVF
jgi:putative ABC transport system substrate-binding protein